MLNIKISHIHLAIAAIMMSLLSSCHGYDEPEDNVYGTFDALWTTIDTRYCFFEEKGVDWANVGSTYRAKIKDCKTMLDFFNLCSDMLAELHDGHVNLSSSFDVSYYRKWWTDYSQNFNLRTLQQFYLEFDYMSASGVIYKVLPGNIAYMYYPSFANNIGEGNLDNILAVLSEGKGLIIDVRDNGGGNMSNIKTLVGRFIDSKMTGGYIQHKTGPGHADFSEMFPLEYEPCEKGRVIWTRPVIVLTNRSCFSAANDFISVMKDLPNVEIAGARTGGGGGIPFTSPLPNGWKVRFSACPVFDASGKSIESGIDPSEGCRMEAPETELALGKDAILDFAIDRLSKLPDLPADKKNHIEFRK